MIKKLWRLATRTPMMLADVASYFLMILRVKHGGPRALHKAKQEHPHRMKRFLDHLGLRIVVHGDALEATRQGPVLFTPNHISELDIPILAAVLPTHFAGKAEIAELPLFAAVAKITGFVPIERYPVFNTKVRGRIRQHLNAGDNMLFFPEGTTNWKPEVRTFRPALLRSLFAKAAVDDRGENVPLQRPALLHPVALQIPAEAHDDYCLKAGIKSLFNLMMRKETVVHVTICPALNPKHFPNAEALATAAHRAVAGIAYPAQKHHTPLWWKQWDGHHLR